jgi:hypothetical protein
VEWKQCSDLFDKAGSEASPTPLQEIADILADVAVQEKSAMEALSRL